MRFDAVINKFVFDANFNKRITIQGDGHQSRPFIQVDQLSLMLSNLITSSLPRGTYNLVEHNRKVIDIVDQLKELLPDLEFLFMDHHVKMNNLVVLPNTNINRSLGVEPSTTFKDELKDFLNQFAF
jgi:UDP-glucose 4-epimerase